MQTPENILLAYRSYNLSAQNYLFGDFSAGEFYLNDANDHLLAAELGALNAYTLGRSGSILSSRVSTLNKQYIVGTPFWSSTRTIDGTFANRVIERDFWGNEILYRSVPQGHLKVLNRDSFLSATKQTSVSPLRSYAERYDGNLVRLVVKRGTMKQLDNIGVSANSATRDIFPYLPAGKSGVWRHNNAQFKVESGQITTQLGAQHGSALTLFNDNLIKFKPLVKNTNP